MTKSIYQKAQIAVRLWDNKKFGAIAKGGQRNMFVLNGSLRINGSTVLVDLVAIDHSWRGCDPANQETMLVLEALAKDLNPNAVGTGDMLLGQFKVKDGDMYWVPGGIVVDLQKMQVQFFLEYDDDGIYSETLSLAVCQRKENSNTPDYLAANYDVNSVAPRVNDEALARAQRTLAQLGLPNEST